MQLQAIIPQLLKGVKYTQVTHHKDDTETHHTLFRRPVDLASGREVITYNTTEWIFGVQQLGSHQQIPMGGLCDLPCIWPLHNWKPS